MNIIAKGVPGKEYIITEMMATAMSCKKFEQLQAINKDRLGGYRFIPQSETDFSWWSRITKKLTPTKIISACFDCDWNGKITQY